MDELIFVYNADSGSMNALRHTLHKVISPETYECRLCQLSHSWFSEKSSWKKFIASLGLKCHFYHRDEFYDAFPQVKVLSFPLVLLNVDSVFSELLSADEFQVIDSIELLAEELRVKLIKAGP